MSLLDRLYFWSLQYDPRTWAGHSLVTALAGIALGVLLLFGAALDWSLSLGIGLSLALTVYVTREALEMLEYPEFVKRKVFDHFMDILCPSLAINLVAWVLR